MTEETKRKSVIREIPTKKFGTSLNGYNKQEVDLFLNDIIKEYNELQSAYNKLSDDTQGYLENQHLISDAIIRARETEKKAEEEARYLIEEAKSNADFIKATAEKESTKESNEILNKAKEKADMMIKLAKEEAQSIKDKLNREQQLMIKEKLDKEKELDDLYEEKLENYKTFMIQSSNILTTLTGNFRDGILVLKKQKEENPLEESGYVVKAEPLKSENAESKNQEIEKMKFLKKASNEMQDDVDKFIKKIASKQ